MVEWLVPVTLFWALSAIYFGGGHVRIEGGTFGQFIGLLDTFVLYLVVWWVVRLLARGVGVIPSVLLATAAASLLLPVLAKVGFRIWGVRLKKATAH